MVIFKFINIGKPYAVKQVDHLPQYYQLDNKDGNTIPSNDQYPVLKDYTFVTIGGNHSSRVSEVVTKITAAIADFDQFGIKVHKVSRFFSNPCFPVSAEPDFVNAAISVSWNETAASLLQRLHELEASYGRERTQRWGQRTLDLDLISVGQTLAPNLKEYLIWRDLSPAEQRVKSPSQMILPHPRLHERAFVLVPLADIASEWRHPVLGLSVQQMRDALPTDDLEAVQPL